MADLLIDDDGAVRLLTMNRPEKRNALNLALSEALFDALRDADSAADIRAIVLTGAGPAFCAGADLSEFAALSVANTDLGDRQARLSGSQTRHRRFGGDGEFGASGRPQGSLRARCHRRADRGIARRGARSGQSRRCAADADARGLAIRARHGGGR